MQAQQPMQIDPKPEPAAAQQAGPVADPAAQQQLALAVVPLAPKAEPPAPGMAQGAAMQAPAGGAAQPVQHPGALP